MVSEHTRRVPELIPLEKIGPKAYFRTMLLFELPDDYDMQECFRILSAAWDAAKERLPVLDCEVVMDPEAQQAGSMKLQKCNDHQSIVCKDLRDAGVFPHSYKELKTKGFPTEALPDTLLWRRYIWPAASERWIAADMQANFIRGGLLLSGCFFHVLGDAKTFYTWFETWAEECRRQQGLEAGPRSEIPDVFFTDREKHMKPSGRNPGRPEDHPEFVVLPFTPPPGAPPKFLSRGNVGQIFRLSKADVARLKDDTGPQNATEPTEATYVSANDALSALMWRSALNAQWLLEDIEGDPISVFNIAVDARTRTDPPIHPRTLGNWLCWVAPRYPLRKMLTTASLADLACEVRKAVSTLDNQITDDIGALVAGAEDISRVVPTSFLDMPGYNCGQTSWATMDIYSLDWGKALGGKAQSSRVPDLGFLNGAQLVLPVLPDGSIELALGVESKALSRLLKDPLLAKYAEAITL
ncbi:hypothetical protein GGR56DRAFT_684351 [Xylariaceae sp. FL0804]|nr:hypothetical protein GGR56DRAFT_684351 [Xylariaceae sp. FL0804]